MTLCFIDHGHCCCQPDEGVNCPQAIRVNARYEYIRTLNVSQFAELFDACLKGARFDDEVDKAIAATPYPYVIPPTEPKS